MQGLQSFETRKKLSQKVVFYQTNIKNNLPQTNKGIIPERYYPANIYLLKGNNRNTRKRGKICSKLTMKTPERRH